ncbi:RNA-directed DNA polymerase, eukaryota, reverse transcriptase zinc-binding domain protein [Tanacetum coccineum]
MFKYFKEQWEDKWENGFMDVEDVNEEENGMSKDVSENVLNAAWNVRGMCNRETQKEVHVSSQSLLCIIETIDSKIKFFCAFIYAANTGRERKELWKNLIRYKRIVNENPWVLMGDWNVSLNNKDHSKGESAEMNHKEPGFELRRSTMEENGSYGSKCTCLPPSVDCESSLTLVMQVTLHIEILECIEQIEIEDLKSCGIHFTWIKSRHNPESGILKKIDRVTGNNNFMGTFHFLPHLSSSDHGPAV